MNQAVVLCFLSIVATESQVFIPPPQTIPLQYSPFFNYLQPQTYSHHLNSLPPNPLSYIVPAHTSHINSPLKTLSVFPNLYRDSRALCSLCSCASDYGCAYNCHKCPALCYTCDCSSSLGCRYNCDKCQENAGGDIQNTKPPPMSVTGVESVEIPVGCVGLQAESELCTWGPICQTIKNAQFPNCDYDCNTCKFASSSDKNEEENAVASKPSNEDGNTIPDSCSILQNELRLCTWGPSCQTIKDAQYPECNYNCATCELEGSEGQADETSPPVVSPVVADPNWGIGDNQQSEDGVSDVDNLNVWKPHAEPVEAEEETDDIPDDCYKLENEIDLCSWGASCQLVKDTQFPECNYNCATCKLESTASNNEEKEESSSESQEQDSGTDENKDTAPPTAASVAQQELLSLWNQFNPIPASCDSVVCEVENSAWKPTTPPTSAVVADSEGEDDDSEEDNDSEDTFTWADFDSSEAETCLALSGPAAGKKCKFPFIHQGVTYKSCAILIESNKERSSSPNSIGWCSTKVDINRYHISGPSHYKWRNVGFCDQSCITNK